MSQRSSSWSDVPITVLEWILPKQIMEWRYLTEFLVFLVLLLGALLLASPYFPNSDVSEEKNKDAYIALNVVGSVIAVFGLYFTYRVGSGYFVE